MKEKTNFFDEKFQDIKTKSEKQNQRENKIDKYKENRRKWKVFKCNEKPKMSEANFERNELPLAIVESQKNL